jgi:hypothetical protein
MVLTQQNQLEHRGLGALEGASPLARYVEIPRLPRQADPQVCHETHRLHKTSQEAIVEEGKIIFFGCEMGKGLYAENVAKAARRRVYAAKGRFPAAIIKIAIPCLKKLENGQIPEAFALFNP